MKIVKRVLIILFFVAIYLTVSTSWANVETVADFYNSLASIVEKAAKDPKACVTKSKSFIDDNMTGLMEAMERDREMASRLKKGEKANGLEHLESDPELAKVMEATREAIDRFMDAMGAFTKEHPEEANAVLDHLKSFKPGVE